jgi:hypothetical protein
MMPVCREIVTDLQRGIEAAAAMKTLVQPGKNLSVWSWTIAVRGDDRVYGRGGRCGTGSERHEDAGIVQDGIVVLERGEVEKHSHCQIMLQSNFKDGNAFNATNAMRNPGDEKGLFKELLQSSGEAQAR